MKTPKTIPQSVKSAVNAYLMARTYAECERERIDSIAREILESAPYYTDPEFITRAQMKSERITDPDKAWMLSKEEHRDFLLDLKKAMQDAGYDIKSIPGDPEYSYCCPALTAECLQTDTERMVIDTAAEMLGENGDFRDNLLCAGLDKYKEFINLVVKMVVSMPDFKNPLTGKMVA